MMPAKSVAASYEALAGGLPLPNGVGPLVGEDGESCPIANRFLWSTCPGCRPSTTRAHQFGGGGILPTRWSLPVERLRGIATPNGESRSLGVQEVLPSRCWLPMVRREKMASPKAAGPLAWGTGSPAQSVAAV